MNTIQKEIKSNNLKDFSDYFTVQFEENIFKPKKNYIKWVITDNKS